MRKKLKINYLNQINGGWRECHKAICFTDNEGRERCVIDTCR